MRPSEVDAMTDEEAIASVPLLGGTFGQFHGLWLCYHPTPGAVFAPNRKARAKAFASKAAAARSFIRRTIHA